jgi:hypothetical protein
MSTIFDNLVTKENDHTNLLRNIMERNPKVAKVILTYLLNRDVTEDEARSFQFSTQPSFSGLNGREIPDILVERDGFRCLIEAKVDPALELTDQQKRGYPAFFLGNREHHLSFLVPNEWKHTATVDQVRMLLSDNNVSVCTSYWRELIKKLAAVSESLNDEVLNEAINFWKWRFEPNPMTAKEREFLNTWSEEKYSAIRKLEKTIDKAKGLFDARIDACDFKTETERSDIRTYGFYIKRGGSYLLWIGIWTKSPTPLSFGFHTTARNWLRPALLPSAPSMANDYHLWPLESETWDDPEKIFKKVKSFLDSYIAD